jgi:hypothetical protein
MTSHLAAQLPTGPPTRCHRHRVIGALGLMNSVGAGRSATMPTSLRERTLGAWIVHERWHWRTSQAGIRTWSSDAASLVLALS